MTVEEDVFSRGYASLHIHPAGLHRLRIGECILVGTQSSGQCRSIPCDGLASNIHLPAGECEVPVSVVQVTQTDVNAGRVTKQINITGEAVNGVAVGDTVETVVNLPRASAIKIGESQSGVHMRRKSLQLLIAFSGAGSSATWHEKYE